MQKNCVPRSGPHRLVVVSNYYNNVVQTDGPPQAFSASPVRFGDQCKKVFGADILPLE
jgi:hypothetical protein